MPQTVCIVSHNSGRTLVDSGISQGFVMDPIVFSICTLPLGAIFRKHQIQYHFYADASRWHTLIWVERGMEGLPMQLSHRTMHWRSETMDVWPQYGVDRKHDRGYYILTVSNRKHLQYVSCVSVSGCKFVPSSTIRNLGIMVDCGLTSHKCVPMCKSIYYHFNAIPKMIYCLTTGACQTLDHALVMCNITEALVSKLQIVQNSAARLIAKQRKHQHITPLLVKLQWLPVRWCVHYKRLVLAFTALHGHAHGYIQDLVTSYSPNGNLRSADLLLLVVPRYNLEGYSRRAVSVTGWALWNSLLEHIHQSDTQTWVKSIQKRHLFQLAYFHWGTVVYDSFTSINLMKQVIDVFNWLIYLTYAILFYLLLFKLYK